MCPNKSMCIHTMHFEDPIGSFGCNLKTQALKNRHLRACPLGASGCVGFKTFVFKGQL